MEEETLIKDILQLDCQRINPTLSRMTEEFYNLQKR